jgi:haloalkane dehalogenase
LATSVFFGDRPGGNFGFVAEYDSQESVADTVPASSGGSNVAETTHAAGAIYQVPTQGGRIHVVDYPGEEPALVLMHGFPDDTRMYERLVPLLAPRRAVTIDFLGYGSSDRPERDVLNAANHADQLRAALDGVGLDRAVLVGHDASGPVAIDFAVAASERVSRLVLLNTYYGHAPTLELPALIRLLADPELAALADAMLDDPNQRLWLLQLTARQWGEDPDDPNGIGLFVVPQFFGDAEHADALPAIRAWTAALFGDLDAQDAATWDGRLATLDIPVTLAFGALDRFLNPDVAAHLAGLFKDAELHLVDGASHWPQWDKPEVVAELIR